MQADGGLVQHIERAYETAAERFRERDTLALAAREGAAHAVERQVAEPHVLHELQARAYLLEQHVRRLLLYRTECQLVKPLREVVHRHAA